MLRISVCLLSVLVFASPGQPQNSSGVAPNPKHWADNYYDAAKDRLLLVTADVYCTPDKKGTSYTITTITHVKTGGFALIASGFLKDECINPKDAKQFTERILLSEEFLDFAGGAGGLDLTDEKLRIPPPAKPTVREQTVRGPKWIYLASHAATNRIDVLDPNTFETAVSISVEPRLFGGMTFSPDGQRLYATLWRSTTATPPLPAQILILDTSTNQVLDRITLTGEMLPNKPAVSLDGKFLYFADGGLVIVDLAGKTVAQTIPGSAAGGATNQLRSLALSPDGGLICVTDNFGVAVLETRTRTFVGRINISLSNRDLPPLIHPNGSRFYVIERPSVAGGRLSASLVGFDMAMLTEVSRTDLPFSNLDPRNLIISPDGLQITMKGFLQSINAPVKAILIAVDTTTNTIAAMKDDIEPAVGALVSIVP